MIMDRHLEYPRLRWPIDMRIETVDGQQVLLLSCSLGIAPAPLGLVAAVSPIIACFEGSLSVAEIVDKFSQYGVSRELVEKLISVLDEGLFLAGPRFDAAQQKIISDFAEASERPAALAGYGYPADAEALARQLEDYLKNEHQVVLPQDSRLTALIAPHIDYRRGQVCYGITYNYLRGQKHDLYILLGTGHQYSRHMFQLTLKDFATPLGSLRCDKELASAVAERYGRRRAFADEILHRREHSLELQAPFLRKLSPDARILPILIGGFHEILQSGKLPEDFEEYESLAAALTQVLAPRLAAGTRICVVAGVDMAHVGRHYGDNFDLTPDFMNQVDQRDRLYMQAIEAGDKRRVFEHVREDQDARRICGFPTVYLTLDLLARLKLNGRGVVYDYRQAVDDQKGIGVTFCGMGIYR